MLTKAILTGSVLSVLAGSIVYFGTEGAGALESDGVETVRIEETELAGAADMDTKAAQPEEALKRVEADAAKTDVSDPPKETAKPKTKWLDQYLKKSKPAPKADSRVIETEIEEVEVEIADKTDEKPEKTKRFHVKKHIKKQGAQNEASAKSSRGESKGTYIVSEGGRIETLDVKGLDLDNLDLEDELDVEALIEELGLELDTEKDIEVRIVKKMGGKPTRMAWKTEGQPKVDYGMVLTEAKKLLVTDMRNQAFLEIMDHAIDQDDVMQAADIVDELSTPELRDTARARIGVDLAKRGDAEAAFAVLDELEIDELSAPIRLQIITALMATKQERKSFVSQ